MTNAAQAKTRGRAGTLALMTALLCAALVAASCYAADCAYAAENAAAHDVVAADGPAIETTRPADDGHAFQVAAYQRIEAPDWANGVRLTWDYVLEACNSADPLPNGSREGRYVWSMTGDERAVFQVPAPEGRGMHSYRMYQQPPAPAPAGYSFDERIYDIQVYVADDGRVYAVICAQEQGGKEADSGWTVVFDPENPHGSENGGSEGGASAGAQEHTGGISPGQGLLGKIFGALPKTGDISLLIAAAAGICACVGLFALVVARRVRERREEAQEDRR